jgi:hypothetical protein
VPEWRPPRPRISLVVECDVDTLPPMNAIVGPGALDGSALEAREETMTGLDVPMTPGSSYWVTSPAGDLFRVDVGEGERCPEVAVRLDAIASDASRALDYATAIATRVHDLVRGPVRDEATGRELDVHSPEHVIVESESERDGIWVRTRGLSQYGRPELEVYGVDTDDRDAAETAMRRLVTHLAAGGSIEPGRRIGVGAVQLVAREGERNRDRWGDAVVLELVDVDVTGHSTEAGAGLGRRDWLHR